MLTGRCGCGAVTYELAAHPMFVHCCHCSDCQRQTGSAFVLNGLIEAENIRVQGPLREVVLDTPSGAGQAIQRCTECGVAVFSAYLRRGRRLAFLRIGTLDDPSTCPPDVHIFTSTRLSWVSLDDGAPVFDSFYDFQATWPEQARQRWHACNPPATP